VGIPDLLAALGAAGATLAVATSKPEPFAVRVLGPESAGAAAVVATPAEILTVLGKIS
jgi:hypothetical protein